jgi:ElaB/YqjD/DUF883 family membrane-anchored ribosome-binding protein
MPSRNREVADLKKQIKDLTDRLSELGENHADELTDRASDFLDHGRDKAGEWLDSLRDQGYQVGKRAKRMAKNAEDYVQDNPWRVAAGALALGVIAGFLLSRHDD